MNPYRTVVGCFSSGLLQMTSVLTACYWKIFLKTKKFLTIKIKIFVKIVLKMSKSYRIIDTPTL